MYWKKSLEYNKECMEEKSMMKDKYDGNIELVSEVGDFRARFRLNLVSNVKKPSSVT